MISYSKAVQYAKSFVTDKELARDLVHDLYLDLHRRDIDMFNTSKRFVYVALHHYHHRQYYESKVYRNGYHFSDIADLQVRSQTPDPEQILIGAQLEETFSPYLRLSIQGYTLAEIGQQTGLSRWKVGRKIRDELSIPKRKSFTEDQIEEIIQLRKLGNTCQEIAKKYGVSHPTISRITNK